MEQGLKASFYTFGCRLNQAETALISNTFSKADYDVVDIADQADVCVINSCTVTAKADADCRQLVRKVLRKNPETFIAVVGCYSQTSSDRLREIEGIDLIVGSNDKMNVLQYIETPAKRPEPIVVLNKLSRQPFTIENTGTELPTTRANIKIQDGCNFMCSFCVVPFARGRARSRAFWDIQREAIELTEAGYKELVITGVNIGTYEFEGKKFLDVVKMLLSVPALKRLRISSIEPATLDEEIFDLMRENEKLCNHLHLPLQSGSDKVLRDMKRHYSQDEFLRFIELGAAKVPDIMIATDIIAGFPTETKQDFEETCTVLSDSPLTYAHIFNYSDRKGTASSHLQNKVDPATKKMRSKILHALSEEKKTVFYKRFIGQILRVLTEEKDAEGRWTGYADNYIKVKIENSLNVQANQFVNVKIHEVGGEFAIGQTIATKRHKKKQDMVGV
ncbi:MAG: tRNA (N(6)-L-threonylcarbamoyladenosine(37)-C(2))-methylthiotransferase MtaB [Deferribacteres bacterium]|nr:tRNA (N(6)-L-threonylcarbamoyladenosine(37)-C(2))-methylthiotransferase MtaB [candidate division KSB1 bacterium]MCB9502298.1 tRNA (N(6)-L-threonylcarbamoyladenosine(37)-C(2))-methylthiotransferase MtaB [Deferribacteres bacterium]